MRYEKYDFRHSFLNASGSSRGDKLVVAEFGKIVGQHPKAVVKAIRSSGIPIMDNATPRELIKVVKRTATKSPRLVANISALMLASSEYDNNFVNFSADEDWDNLFGKKKDGTERKGLGLGKLFQPNPNKPKKEKGKFLQSIFGSKDATTGKRSGGLFSKQEGGSKIGNWLRGKKGQEVDGVVQDRSGFGDWLSSNQEGLGNIATSFMSGLFSSGGEQSAQNTAEQNQGGDGGGGDDDVKKGGGISPIMIGGGLLVVGLVIFLIVRGRGGKGKKK